MTVREFIAEGVSVDTYVNIVDQYELYYRAVGREVVTSSPALVARGYTVVAARFVYAVEHYRGGDAETAFNVLHRCLQADTRCIDAYVHLGNFRVGDMKWRWLVEQGLRCYQAAGENRLSLRFLNSICTKAGRRTGRRTHPRHLRQRSPLHPRSSVPLPPTRQGIRPFEGISCCFARAATSSREVQCVHLSASSE